MDIKTIKLKHIIGLPLVWVGLTTSIQMFKCSEMTRTELFLNINKTALLWFKTCK